MIISNIIKIIRAFKYSWAGLRQATRGEHAFQQELFIACIMLPLGFFFCKNTVEFCVLFATGMLILITELINSAVERAVDRVGTDYNELAGKAKDLASAAVFLSIINAAVIWSLILIF